MYVGGLVKDPVSEGSVVRGGGSLYPVYQGVIQIVISNKIFWKKKFSFSNLAIFAIQFVGNLRYKKTIN